MALGDMAAGCHDSEDTHGDGSNLHGVGPDQPLALPRPKDRACEKNSEDKVAASSDAGSQNMRLAVCQILRMTGIAEKELHAHACPHGRWAPCWLRVTGSGGKSKWSTCHYPLSKWRAGWCECVSFDPW